MKSKLNGAEKAPVVEQDRRLERALSHVNDLWFPPSPDLLKRIKSGLSDGHFDISIDFLIRELKSDFALFAYCLKETTKMLRQEGTLIPPNATPTQVLKLAGLKRLKEVLNVHERVISQHRFTLVNTHQANRIKEAMISASVAEALCDGHKVDPELGYSSGLLRHLGLTLIAWNYPTVYRRAMEQVKNGANLEEELTMALGFSPTALAVRLVEEWSFSPCITHAVGGTDNQQDPGEMAQVSNTLKSLCQVGEALARAQDPEQYPTASKDWNLAKHELEKQLGHDGMRYIQSKVKSHMTNYLQDFPELFAATNNINAERKLSQHLERKVLASNPYAVNCTPELKKKLKELYSKIEPNTVSQEQLKELFHRIIPSAGFSGGVVYTVDQDSSTLVLRTRIGHTNTSIPVINLKSCQKTSMLEEQMIVSAFKTKPELELEPIFIKGDTSTTLAAALGSLPRIGVLMLELPSCSLIEGSFNATLNFKAIRQALQDCLHLS